ncbi:MAG TPA: 3-dehydroquinate synthase [Mucilaginibacter sp.]|jgi:3-dehydroquinate synthase|nr:3-dehydroquinate synthase [Mucilaginibacter sp.]
MKTIQSDGYPIFFENSIEELATFVKAGNYSRTFILTDENTAEHCLPLVEKYFEDKDNYDLIEVPYGEENKSIDTCIGIWKLLIDFGADRKALMINLGGGVITDMGGFAASTFKRGIDFVQVPTTLLSQVDASVGGKTGIDLDGVKNIIGTFTQPRAVFISDEFLKTLPPRQVLSGTAEMLKHGLIMDKGYWESLKASDLSKPHSELIYRSVEIKNEVVKIDPTEKGLRKALNFGHTIGHAVETHSLLNDKDPLTHGEAIALGMICEACLSHKKAGLSKAELDEITAVLTKLYPKYNLAAANFTELGYLMLKDKKNEFGRVNCTLLSAIGTCKLDNICTEEELFTALEYYAGL